MNDQSKETELKPCPFDLGHEVDVTMFLHGGFRVTCKHGDCNTWGPFRESVEDAITAWNHRTPDTAQLLKDKEELMELLDKTAASIEEMVTAKSHASRTEPVHPFTKARYDAHWRAAKASRALLARLSPEQQEQEHG